MFNRSRASTSVTTHLRAATSNFTAGRRRLAPPSNTKSGKRVDFAASPSVDRHNEQAIVARAQRGDEEAFAALYNAYRRRVYSLCLRMIHDEVAAEDLTQEAFLHLFRKISSFRGESAFGTWLHRMVVNVVLMRLRKKSLHLVPLEEAPPHPGEEESGRHDFGIRQYGHEDRQLSSAVDRITLGRAVSELPEGYRTVLLLHDLEGYEHSEIARLKQCSVGNSKSQLHKARVKLRRLLRGAPAARRAALRALSTVVSGVKTGGWASSPVHGILERRSVPPRSQFAYFQQDGYRGAA